MRSIVQCAAGEGQSPLARFVENPPHPDRIWRCDPTSPRERGEVNLLLLPSLGLGLSEELVQQVIHRLALLRVGLGIVLRRGLRGVLLLRWRIPLGAAAPTG